MHTRDASENIEKEAPPLPREDPAGDDGPDVSLGLDTSDPSVEVLHVAFKSGVQKLESGDRELVIDQFTKLRDAFSVFGKTVEKILSTEEGRRLFEQEAKRRQET